jgi:hypothetical protein
MTASYAPSLPTPQETPTTDLVLDEELGLLSVENGTLWRKESDLMTAVLRMVCLDGYRSSTLASLCVVPGEIQIWIDGKSAIKVSGVTISETQEDGSTSLFRGAHFQTFFGGKEINVDETQAHCSITLGSSPQYASPKDQHAYFANVSGAVIN